MGSIALTLSELLKEVARLQADNGGNREVVIVSGDAEVVPTTSTLLGSHVPLDDDAPIVLRIA